MTSTPPPLPRAAAAPAIFSTPVPSPPDYGSDEILVLSPLAALAQRSTIVDFRKVTWDDVNEDGEGKATGVLRISWEILSSKQLRTICSQLGLRGVKNAKKSDMIHKLCGMHSNKKVYNVYRAIEEEVVDQEGGQLTTTTKNTTRKEAQCSFRLINVLFSDDFAGGLATLGDVANRELLDSGRAANDEHFWVRVRAAYVETSHPDYNTLDFVSSDEIFLAQDHIDPIKIVPHDWKKLRTIWKGINADYKAALARYTVSGTHEDNFYNFCYGKLDVYYLRKKLDGRPNLTATVEADLPKDCALASDMGMVIGENRGIVRTPPSSSVLNRPTHPLAKWPRCSCI